MSADAYQDSPSAAGQSSRGAELPDERSPGRTSRRRRRWLIVAVVVVAGLGVGGWYGVRHRTTAGDKPMGLPPSTATVTRQDLAQTQQVDGTLGYGPSYRLSSGRPGTLTWLPPEGSTVTRGHPLYRVNNQPVPLFYGALPLYRTLEPGVDDGQDVRETEQNLAALGYGGFTIDDHYSEATALAVEDWQADQGLPQTGVLSVGDLVVLPGPIRVDDATTQTGDQLAPGRPVFSYTSTARTVTVALDVADEQLAATGEKVTVELPGGTDTPGTVEAVGTVAQAPAGSSAQTEPGGSGNSGAASDATITVTVALDRPASARGLDQAPVEVDFTSEQRRNVLTVPIAALLALPGGGYGLQVVNGRSTHIVPVSTGLFADTRVQVSGNGLKEGMKVGVPAS